jgi:hypothetical protein
MNGAFLFEFVLGALKLALCIGCGALNSRLTTARAKPTDDDADGQTEREDDQKPKVQCDLEVLGMCRQYRIVVQPRTSGGGTLITSRNSARHHKWNPCVGELQFGGVDGFEHCALGLGAAWNGESAGLQPRCDVRERVTRRDLSATAVVHSSRPRRPRFGARDFQRFETRPIDRFEWEL